MKVLYVYERTKYYNDVPFWSDYITKPLRSPHRFTYNKTLIRVDFCNHFSKFWDFDLNIHRKSPIELRLFDLTSETERLSFEIEYGIKLENEVVFSQSYDKAKGTFDTEILTAVLILEED